jgi:uncharacterized NAD(P)/FAD-binding protein YdhS
MKKIAIIGGGASGALTAIHCLPRLREGDEIVLLEKSLRPGTGAAFGTTDPCHLLNVRASSMSLFPDDPSHFCEWMEANGLGVAKEIGPQFIARVHYGKYIEQALKCAVEESAGSLTVLREHAESFDAADGKLALLTDSSTVEADAFVLALGHIPPRLPRSCKAIADSPRFINKPWMPGALGSIGKHDTVFAIGLGLTMIDQLMSLHQAGFQGRIIARSRRGLLPNVHTPVTSRRFELGELIRDDLFQFVIHQCRDAGDEWRDVVDGLRPHTPAAWAALSPKNRRRFLKFLTSYWSIHRSRIPVEASEAIERLRAEGRLDVGAGVISSAEVEGNKIRLGLRGSQAESFSVDWVINCTGPDTDWRAAKVPLVESAVAQGLAVYDDMGLGLKVDVDGKAEPRGRLWALGPICLGARWETIAIPEIRAQAKRIAELLAT